MTECIAFTGITLLAKGAAPDVARAARQAMDRGRPVLVFDAVTSRAVDFDFRGDADETARRAAAMFAPEEPEPVADPALRKAGRPKLGVTAREVTLLPRHWDWLAAQPGGASAALRRLVEAARRDGAGPDAARAAQDSAYRFMSAMAGNAPDFEEAMRAFFARDRERFLALSESWPSDVRAHARALAEASFIA